MSVPITEDAPDPPSVPLVAYRRGCQSTDVVSDVTTLVCLAGARYWRENMLPSEAFSNDLKP